MTRNHPNQRLSFGPFLLDPHTHELWKHGIKIKLARQPFEILSVLLQNPGELITREQLRDLLWPGDTFVDFDHGLNAAINKLREALDDSADSPTYIETLPRRGYRFLSSASSPDSVGVALGRLPFPTSAGLDPSSIDTQSFKPPTFISASLQVSENLSFRGPHSPEESASSSAPLATRHSLATFFRPRRYFLAATILLSLLLATTFLLKRVSSSTTHPPAASLPRIKPLTNLSDETSEPSFSPSGDLIAFHRDGSTPETSGIFVQSISTGAVTQLTRSTLDCCPAWSPDGRTIAFSRLSDYNHDISLFTIPFPSSAQNSEPKLNTPATLKRPELAFSPDGSSLIFTGPTGLVSLSLQNFTTRALTQAPPSSQDWGPAFSPDGRQLLFVRSGEADFSDQLLTIPANGGEVTQIASEHARILGPPQWTSDGSTIIFASGRGSHPGLWRVSAQLRDSPVQVNDSGWYPAISRSTSRLAYQRITRSLNIWEIDLAAGPHDPRILVPSTSETDQGPAPQISPDNKKLAFMSDSSGTMEIWVSDRDGSNARQLTSIGDVGTPRWSPDSQSIVFDAGRRNGHAIYTINLNGAPPQLLTPDNFNVCPSWSLDGKWVYFSSSRTGNFQVWKVPSQGGTPSQVTLHGGHATLPSLDGKFIYYAKSQYANPEIWQIPTNGGPENLVSPQLRPATWASWAVTDKGIVFAEPSGKGRPVVSLFDAATHRVKTLATLQIVPFWLSASPDASAILFDQPGWQQAQIMLVDNFH